MEYFGLRSLFLYNFYKDRKKLANSLVLCKTISVYKTLKSDSFRNSMFGRFAVVPEKAKSIRGRKICRTIYK